MTEATKTTDGNRHEAVKHILEPCGVRFHRPDAWHRVEEHVGTHKYLLDLRIKRDNKWTEAAGSWQKNVFEPLYNALERRRRSNPLSRRPAGDLYIEVFDHWYFLKLERETVTPEEAVDSFERQFDTHFGVDESPQSSGSWKRRLSDGWERARRIANKVQQSREENLMSASLQSSWF